jgi:hypothetical protein
MNASRRPKCVTPKPTVAIFLDHFHVSVALDSREMEYGTVQVRNILEGKCVFKFAGNVFASWEAKCFPSLLRAKSRQGISTQNLVHSSHVRISDIVTSKISQNLWEQTCTSNQQTVLFKNMLNLVKVFEKNVWEQYLNTENMISECLTTIFIVVKCIWRQ